MWINYQFMEVCPLILISFAQISPKMACFAHNFGLPNFLPQLANFFTRIYPSYPWHFPTLTRIYVFWVKFWHRLDWPNLIINNYDCGDRSFAPVLSRFPLTADLMQTERGNLPEKSLISRNPQKFLEIPKLFKSLHFPMRVCYNSKHPEGEGICMFFVWLVWLGACSWSPN